MKQVHFTRPDTARGSARPRLDLRLATLAELGIEAYGQRPDELERALVGFRREGPLAFLRGGDRADGFESSSPQVAQVFVTVTEPAALDRIAAALEKQGGHILSRATTIATVHLPLRALREIEDRPDVVAIEWSGAFRPAASADPPERRTVFSGPLGPRAAMGMDGLPAWLDGKGTLIGVVDCGGIDLYHPAFVDEQGRTRLRALWDQRAAPASDRGGRAGAPAQPRYGRAYGHAALDREVSPRNERPYSIVGHQAVKGSHGTATAGIAAGLGGERPGARGVAPGAGIVYVDTYGSGAGALGAMTELADALRFIFDVAAADHAPCAVNVSLGDDLGPHDGTSPVERFLDELVEEAPGRAVIVAAGNSAARRRHASIDFSEARDSTLEIDVGPRNRQSVVLEVWYDAGEGEGALDVEIEAPGGGRTGLVPPGGVPRAYDSGETRVLVASASRAPVGRSAAVRVELVAAGGDELCPGIWKVHLRARGVVRGAHAWIDHRYVQLTARHGDPRMTVTSPATARRAICVGAYDLVKGKLCWYSGRGPGRGDRPKPDLLAPGGPLVTASARTTRRYADLTCGTSVAAPLVTGAAALLFQRFGPGLTREELLAKLAPPARASREADGAPVATLARLAEEDLNTVAVDRALPLDCSAQHERVENMDKPNYVKPADAVQIWAGEYKLNQGGNLVGKLFVEELSGPAHTKEHWLLYSTYRWPSSTFTSQEIVFEYQGAPGSLTEFLSSPPEGSTYIIATCDQQTLP